MPRTFAYCRVSTREQSTQNQAEEIGQPALTFRRIESSKRPLAAASPRASGRGSLDYWSGWSRATCSYARNSTGSAGMRWTCGRLLKALLRVASKLSASRLARLT
jgi:hypothetical protein